MEVDGVNPTGNAIWHVQMLGRLRARSLPSHAPVVLERFQTQKTALLLALLIMQETGSATGPLYRSDLAARLWPDAEPEVGRDRLSQALSWLRRNLEASVGLQGGAIIRADRYVIGLAPDAVSSDIGALEALLKEERAGDRNDAQRSAALLGQAIALYQGLLLPGLADEDELLLLERQRLEAVFEAALRRAAIVSVEAGEASQAVEYARRLLQTDPQNDMHCALLMRLLFRAGNASGAMRAYTDFIERLRGDGMAAPAALSRLAGEIKERAASAMIAAAAPVAAASNPAASNLAASDAVATKPASSKIASSKIASPDPVSTDAAASNSVAADASPSEPPGPAAMAPLASILPLPLTRYFGREQELRVILTALEARETRLMTLLGAGGSGKTRLAVEAARRFVLPDADAATPTASATSAAMTSASTSAASAPAASVPAASAPVVTEEGRAAFFVSLENVNTAEQIMPAVLRVLQQADGEAVQEGAAQSDGPAMRSAVARLLGGCARPLLVLDNAETVAGGAETARVIADLLLRVPALCILATSRVRLGVEGEQQLFVAPLPSPHDTLPDTNAAPSDAQDALLLYPSVRLFLDRARHARLDFGLTPENREVIGALCGRLEGIPLAIELCAAWATTLSAEEMLAALDSRFDLLVSRRPDVPARHRSLYAAVESSYLLLPPDLKAVFCALSVFRSGWTADAALAVADRDASGGRGAAIRVRAALAALQERSLILTEGRTDGGGKMRWRMLETLREFAWAQMPEQERAAAAAHHADWCLQYAEDAVQESAALDPRVWMDALEIEQDNFQAALAAWRAQYSRQAEPHGKRERRLPESNPLAAGLRLCLALDRFWLTRGYSAVASEHLAWFLPRLQNEDGDTLDFDGADFTAVNVGGSHIEGAGSRARLDLLAQGYTALGRAYAAQGDLPRALAPLETALALWRVVGNPRGMAGAQMDVGEVCYWLGRKTEALALLAESEAAARKIGDALLCAAALLTQGSIALDARDIPRAEHLHLEALAFARQKDNRRLMARVSCNLAEIAREQGRLEDARTWGREALAAADIGDQAAGCYIRLSLGRTACDEGEPVRAARYLQDCLRYVQKAGTRRLTMLCLLLAAQIAGLEGRQEQCAALLGASEALRDETSLRLIQGEAEVETALREGAERVLGAAAYMAAFARGLAMTPEAASAFALDRSERA